MIPAADPSSGDLIGPIDLVLVRHGESTRNHASDLAHHGDPSLLEWQMREERDEALWPLTDEGRRQSEITGNWLRASMGAKFDAGYVSPFVRTLQTAEGLGLDVAGGWKVEDRLRERQWGDYLAAGVAPYSTDQYLIDLAHSSELEWKTDFPGAESVLDLVPRVGWFLEEAFRATPRGRIIAVTHGGTIRAIQTVLQPLQRGGSASDPDHRLTNCGVVVYRLQTVALSSGFWEGKVRVAHPTLPGEPQMEWP